MNSEAAQSVAAAQSHFAIKPRREAAAAGLAMSDRRLLHQPAAYPPAHALAAEERTLAPSSSVVIPLSA